MSTNNIVNSRNSTPEVSSASLRPPASRLGPNAHHLRASADMSTYNLAPMSSRSVRPTSELLYNQAQSFTYDAADRAAEQWIAEIDQCETTLEEMAGATTDQDFKAELTAIEEWFRVLSEAERTASLYALLQQATTVQIVFFIQLLEEMLGKHPAPGVHTSAKIADQNDANTRAEVVRNQTSRQLPSPAAKRHSGLDSFTINAMFPDAAAAIAKKRAELTHLQGNASASNRNSVTLGDRYNMITPSITAPKDSASLMGSPWGQRPGESRPKSSSGQTHGSTLNDATVVSSTLRSPINVQHKNDGVVQSQSISVPDNSANLPILSPYNLGNASWASMSNTPMQPTFNTSQAVSQADMVANATAMKLAALSTVNNRIALDDVRKYRRTKSSDAEVASTQQPLTPSFPQNLIVVNESGHMVGSSSLGGQQLAAMQAHQQANFSQRRGRPESPKIVTPAGFVPAHGFSSSRNNGYLTAYDAPSTLNTGISSLSLGQYGGNLAAPQDGYLSDHSDNRGRSPRGRRGTSKPPEDPTDLALLQDIPNWLKSLRLHKYTDNLKCMDWKELIELDEKGLEEKGVNALGARRKMLKAFEQIREAKADGKL